MSFLTIIAQWFLGLSSQDACARLCTFDGPSICTEGSSIIHGDICHRYFHGGPRGDYCYFNGWNVEFCSPDNPPVRVGEVDFWIDYRQRVPVIPTTTTTTTTRPRQIIHYDPIISAIERLPNVGFWDGEKLLRRRVMEAIRKFTPLDRAAMRWDKARGTDLLGLAESYIDEAPVLVVPLLMLVGNICSMPTMAKCRPFLIRRGVHRFLNSGKVVRFIRDYHKGLQNLRLNTEIESRLYFGFVGPLVPAIPTLMDSADLRSIVFDHRYYLHRTRTGNSHMGSTVFRVNRETALFDSLCALTGPELLRSIRFSASFNSERAQGRGVTKDWFAEVAKQISDPQYGLFQPRRSEAPHYMELSPLGTHHELFYRAVGRFMALAIVAQNPVGLALPVSFLAKFVGQELTLKDIREDEPSLYKSMVYLESLTSDEELAEFEISIDGVDHQVTLNNRRRLITRKINSLIDPAVRGNLNIIVHAFHEMIPQQVLADFSAKALKELIVGHLSIDVTDMMRNAVLTGYTRESPQIKWLEKFLRDQSPEMRRDFWRFCSATTQVPCGGFGALEEPFKIDRSGSTDLLPTTSTCFNNLHLPPYETEEDLRRKVSIAIHTDPGMGFL